MNPFPAIIKKGSARLQLVEAGSFLFWKRDRMQKYMQMEK